MTNDDKRKLRKFKKYIRDWCGKEYSKIIFESHEDEHFVLQINESQERHGVTIKQIALMVVSQMYPIKLTIHFDMYGVFREDEDVRKKVQHWMRHWPAIDNIEVRSMSVEGMFPFVADSVAFVQCEDCTPSEPCEKHAIMEAGRHDHEERVVDEDEQREQDEEFAKFMARIGYNASYKDEEEEED